MADDVKDWLSQSVACIKRKSPVGRHHPLGHIPTGHRWDRIAMDILDVCDPTPEGFRYILVIADYFSKWTEAFPMKNKLRRHGGRYIGGKDHFAFWNASGYSQRPGEGV